MFIMIINPKNADVPNNHHHYIKFHRCVIREAVESEFGFPHGACFNRYILYALLDKITPK